MNRVYFNWNLDASFQMALDQALFENLQSFDSVQDSQKVDAFLRFYTIQPRAFTVGYFIQDLPQVLKEDSDLPLVRRLTGGGIVRHDGDLVFSLGADSDRIPFLKNTSESYVAIHSVLQKAFQKEGIQAELVSCKAAASHPETSQVKNVCFRNPVAGDLMVRGQKAAGGAQKREKSFFLHQGSIDLRHLRGQDPRAFAQTLLDSFAENWDLDFTIDELSPALLERTRELSETRYRPLEALLS